jgi:hypothetical protein
MTREERAEELTRLRRTDPARLIGIYRAATNTALLANLPRGLGFTGMIAAILESEYPPESILTDTQDFVPLDVLLSEPLLSEPEPGPALLDPPTPVRRWNRVAEFRAFCSGGAIVLTGLLMAAGYLILVRHFPV